MKRTLKLIILAAWLVLPATAQKNHNFEVSKNLEIFNNLFKQLDLYYVDTLDADKLVKTATGSMLNTLDPYTEYYPDDERDDLKQMLTGKYAGIGSLIHYSKNEDRCIISEPFENMPAAEGGLKAGDVILSIAGKEFGPKGSQNTNEFTESVSNALRGEPGTSFIVKIQRPGEDKPREIKLTRRAIKTPPISYYGMIAENTGYIYLSSFPEGAATDVRRAVIDLKQKGAKQLVLDLRNNGGGSMQEAIDLVNLFIGKGKTVVELKGKIKSANETYKTQREALDPDIPLAVLVNGNTASSSEITAGTLQDYDRAVVIGTRTYGKGLVQQPIDFSDGSAIRLTIARYYTPSGRCIQRPYENGKDSKYEMDWITRYEHGEFFSKDSIKLDENLRYSTGLGRPVYGGGGIMPDVFVPQDTTGVSSYLIEVSNKGLILQFSFQYTDRNRAKLSEYDNEEDLLKYLRHQSIVEQFVRFADSKGVKRRNLLIHKSYKLLERSLYGNIIYNILGREQYIRYINQSDATVKKALDILERGEAFPKAPEATPIIEDKKDDGKEKRTAQAGSFVEDPTQLFRYASVC